MSEQAIGGGDWSGTVVRPAFGGTQTSQEAGVGGGGSNGGGSMEDDRTRAQNDARFAEVLAELRSIRESAVSWRGMWAAAGTTIISILGLGLAFLSYASDRFDGGLAAGALDRPIIQAQEKRDAEQDRKLDQILKAVEQIRDKPQRSPSQG